MRLLLIIISQEARESWANELVVASKCEKSLVVVAGPGNAARYVAEQKVSPSHVVLDIGNRGRDVLTEIDELAQQCDPGTRVVAVGDTNDIVLYREMLSRGVIDYLPMPAVAEDIVKALSVVATPTTKATAAEAAKRVLVFMSAGSGDGASTVALNTAYAISQKAGGNTVLVDMDYQFGMVAKHLSLQSQYGIRDLFDYPGRGVDSILIKRMVANYGKLHVITAPSELRYLPNVSSESIRELVITLKQSYENVIIDLPHIWLPWVAAAAEQATHLMLVSQLWLKSVSHAARLVRALRDVGVPPERINTIINRSGAKFKEAIAAKDFERVCNLPIRYTIANDIKTVVDAEATATTIMELPSSNLSNDIMKLVRGLLGDGQDDAGKRSGGLFSLRKG